MGKKRKGVTPKSIEERVAQGNEAETLLQSPVFIEACDLLEDKYVNAWISSGIGDEQKREQYYLSLKVLSEVKLEIESMINSGKIAKQLI
jgi:hypothetical protein|tara:strand:+ start:2588 stop:2857 length:270 start_codon:yes stop_codon:yes gene_type:complete